MATKKKAPTKKAAKKAVKPAAKKKAASNAAAPVGKPKNGVVPPTEGTRTAKLWALFDKTREKIKSKEGREVARFECMKAAKDANPDSNHDTISNQFFQWRKYNGIKAGAAGVNPKRGTYEPNVKVAKTARTSGTKENKANRPKAAKKAAGKTAVTVERGKPLPKAVKKAVAAKAALGSKKGNPAVAKKAAKKAPTKAKAAPKAATKPGPGKTTGAVPATLSRAEKLAKQAKAAQNTKPSSVPDGGITIIPPIED